MPRQRSLPIYPEPERNGLLTELQPIARPHSLRQISRLKRGEPVMVRLDLIRAAKANSGLTDKQIGELIIGKSGKPLSRWTVAKALRVDPGVDFHTVCEVMNVIGVEMAELFPIRNRLPERKPMAPTWTRGEHMRENAARLLREQELNEAKESRPRRRKRK